MNTYETFFAYNVTFSAQVEIEAESIKEAIAISHESYRRWIGLDAKEELHGIALDKDRIPDINNEYFDTSHDAFDKEVVSISDQTSGSDCDLIINEDNAETWAADAPDENEQRASRILEALKDYRSHVEGDNQTAITDLLTDIRHFCDMREVNFHAALDTSYKHYLAERQ